jgi:signal transduction histidine kinase
LTTSKRTNEERNIKRVVLLGSTFVVLIVSLVIAYLLISSEIESTNDYIKSFETTHIDREKFAIKSVVENLKNDITYETNSNKEEIKHQVKNQSMIAYNLALSLALQNRDKSKEEVIKIIKEITKSATDKNNQIHYFIFDDEGTLLLDTKNEKNEGKNFIDSKDMNEKSFVQDILHTNGFVEYFWYKPNESKIAENITFSNRIAMLGITIGSGSTIELNHTLSKKIVKKIEKENLSSDEFMFFIHIKIS